MAEYKDKIVEYENWCHKCKHKNKEENEDPCWDCLTTPVNEHSKKPICWEENR